MRQWKQIELLVKTHGITCEGPVWDSVTNKLYYLDITGKKLHVFQWGTKSDKVTDLPQKVGFLALTTGEDLLLGLEDGVYRYPKGGNLQLAHDRFVFAGERFNDGKVGPDGRLYAGTIQREGGAKLYCFEGAAITTLLENIKISNGLDWSMDGRTFYYCDTPTHQVDAFDFEIKKGAISNRRTIITIPEECGSPDGLTIDIEGNLWIALWKGGRVIKVNSGNGEIIGEVVVPVSRVSCCCFAGENLDCLVITTASGDGVAEREPLAGCVFVAKVGTYGRVPFRFNN
jgi:sugar lactone lactonase YvrE